MIATELMKTDGIETENPLELYVIEHFGYDEWIQLCHALGGERLYVPRGPSKAARDAAICKDYETIITTGTDVPPMVLTEKLAKKYNLSTRQISRVLRMYLQRPYVKPE